MKIETGESEQHTAVLPLDASGLPAVAPATATAPAGSEQGAVRDLTGERLSQLAAAETDAAAAMTSGMSADADRRGRYEASMTPLGASGGDQMAIPVVPDNAVPPAQSYGYPFAGMEPTPAAAGWDYTGAEPGG